MYKDTLVTKRHLDDFTTVLDWAIGDPDYLWLTYAEGYKLAYERLITSIVLDDYSKPDHHKLIHPLIYLVRHSIELYLKAGILYLSRLEDENIDIEKIASKCGHDIEKLSEEFFILLSKSSIQDSTNGKDREFHKQLKNTISNIKKLSKDHAIFRYPVNRKGERILKNCTPNFNFIEFHNSLPSIEDLANLIDWIAKNIEFKRDLESNCY